MGREEVRGADMQNCLMLVGLLFLVGCGNGSSSTGSGEIDPLTNSCANSPVLGNYTGFILGNVDVMTIKSNCAITSTYCAATATFQNVSGASGNVVIDVKNTSGKAGCLPLGKTACGYFVGNNVLQFSCGGGTLTYSKSEQE
jgi:hypothetical protein